jgi:hypothetical protein
MFLGIFDDSAKSLNRQGNKTYPTAACSTFSYLLILAFATTKN